MLFIDDLNSPRADEYGTVPTEELLRQLLGCGGLYNYTTDKTWSWTQIQDLILLGACNKVDRRLSPRLARFVHTVNFSPEPSEESMSLIFSSLLNAHLSEFPFDECVKNTVQCVVNASIELLKGCQSKFLPTPKRYHYCFTMRDLARLFQGMLSVKPPACQSENAMVALWSHEAMRCFKDRLIDCSDRQDFDQLMEPLIASFECEATIKDPMFGYFGSGVGSVQSAMTRLYEELPNCERVRMLLEAFLADFNSNNASRQQMSLVLFDDAVQHVTRTARILSSPQGSSLMLGAGGSGKASLTRLASHVASCSYRTIELTKSYNAQHFRVDLKEAMLSAGIEGKQVAFVLKESQIFADSILEDISIALKIGLEPSWLNREDHSKIVAGLGIYMQGHDMRPTPDNCYKTFVQRVRSNLHMVLCMPFGAETRQRLQMFPALLNCCTIDYFDEWPPSALLEVTEQFFGSLDVGSVENRAAISTMCVDIHSQALSESERYWHEQQRRYYVTTSSYLEFMLQYQANLDRKRGQIGQQRDKLMNGLRKLSETEDIVAELEETFHQLQPELIQKDKQVAELVQAVVRTEAKTAAVQAELNDATNLVRRSAESVNAVTEDMQADLEKAVPAMNVAADALDGLKRQDIVQLKNCKAPSPAVVLVLHALLLLLDYPSDECTWHEAKALMSDTSFLAKCKAIDKDSLDQNKLEQLDEFLQKDEFEPSIVESKSPVASKLCLWVVALGNYARVAKTVQPKALQLRAAKETLEAAQMALTKKREEADDAESQLAETSSSMQNRMAEKQGLMEESERYANHRTRAASLMDALGSETARWQESAHKLDRLFTECIGSVLISSAFLAYLGPLDLSFRRRISSTWVQQCQELGLPVSDADGFSLTDIMAKPQDVQKWQLEGLPSSTVAMENAIFVTESTRWPLMIDPQCQARDWLTKKYKKSGSFFGKNKSSLSVIKPGDPYTLRVVEQAIRTGTALVLENVGETNAIDPNLEPLFIKQVYTRQNRSILRLGDIEIDYDPLFKFYVTTKLANPHFSPRLCTRMTVINFTVTSSNLQEQLLAHIMRLKHPELESANCEMIESTANLQQQQSHYEDQILTLLKDSNSNILENEELVSVLADSKKSVGALAEHLVESEAIKIAISKAHESYQSLSDHCTVLYFVLANLFKVNAMYQYSLKWLEDLIAKVLERSPKAENRCDTLISSITESVITSVHFGLFEKDRVVVAFVFCSSIMRSTGSITEVEWDFFCRGTALSKPCEFSDSADASWISSQTRAVLAALEDAFPVYKGLCADIVRNSDAWQSCIHLPGLWNQIGAFQKLMLIKYIWPERGSAAIGHFAEEQLREQWADLAAPELDKDFLDKSTSNRTATLFICSRNADPCETLILVNRQLMETQMSIVLLDQPDQLPKATQMIEDAVRNGNWVLLQNCHLAPSFMPELDLVLESMIQRKNICTDFRLFLTSKVSQSFSVSILQNSIKVVVEEPHGMRARMLRSYKCFVTEELLATCNENSQFKKLAFGLVFLHASLQERAKYGPLGKGFIFADFNVFVFRVEHKVSVF